MNLTDEDVLKILKLVEESDFDSLQLEYGDLKLLVSKSGLIPGLIAAESSAPSIAVAQSAETTAAKEPGKPAMVKESPSVSKETHSDITAEEGFVAIKAPMVGAFYYSPEPGADPFVSVGSKIDEDTTVGLIEVMKVFSSVTSGVKGEIVKILIEDAQLVEYGQTIFLVRPDEGK